MKRWIGREGWRRVASYVLVAVIASFSLSSGVLDAAASTVSGSQRSISERPVKRPQIRRIHTEVRTLAARRPWSEQDVHLPAGAWLVPALTLLGFILLRATDRPAWSPGPLPVQRGPPSSS
jgi:hypothetical protein